MCFLEFVHRVNMELKQQEDFHCNCYREGLVASFGFQKHRLARREKSGKGEIRGDDAKQEQNLVLKEGPQ